MSNSRPREVVEQRKRVRDSRWEVVGTVTGALNLVQDSQAEPSPADFAAGVVEQLRKEYDLKEET